jgi:SSS family solute:Na+ symporter
VVIAVSIHVFLGGMRGAAWVNTFQTILFLVFGTIAFVLIGQHLGGYDHVMAKLAESKVQAALLSREKIAPRSSSAICSSRCHRSCSRTWRSCA